MVKHSGIDLLFVVILFTVCWYTLQAYQQFWGAAWTFDDARVFSDLNNIGVSKTTLDFVTDAKEISRFGRPVSLGSFLLNIGDWPNNPAGFREINTLIHITNILLLALVSLQLTKIIPCLTQYGTQFSVVLAMAWGLHPFLASTSFHAIQRMTLLSSTFILLAFLTYLIGREQLSKNPYKGYGLISAGIIFFGCLGVLSKENALLTPLLIGVMEFTLLSHYRPINTRFFAYWRLFFFGLSSIILTIYAGYYLITSNGYLIRPFSLSDRLFSESLILFQYIAQILLPQIKHMGPFQDDLSYIQGISPVTVTASTAWILLVSVALWRHNKWPIFSFAVLFFITAHLLESTIFNLELYFEHRNYLASAAILSVLIGVLWASSKPILQLASILYTLLLAGLLWSLSNLWGSPILAPIAWTENHPTSVRASQVYTTMLWNIGSKEKASKAIMDAYTNIPLSSSLATNVLTYACFDTKYIDAQQVQNTIGERAQYMHYGRAISGNMFTILDMMKSQQCDALSPSKIIYFLRGLLSNPRFTNKEQRFAFLLLINRFAILEGDKRGAAIAHMQGYKIKPWTGGLSFVYCELIATGEMEKAHTFLDEYKTTFSAVSPSSPFATPNCESNHTKMAQ